MLKKEVTTHTKMVSIIGFVTVLVFAGCQDTDDTSLGEEDTEEVCQEACVNLCGIDHTTERCRNVCDSYFDQDPDGDCAKLWQCASQIECEKDQWVELEDFCTLPENWAECIYSEAS